MTPNIHAIIASTCRSTSAATPPVGIASPSRASTTASSRADAAARRATCDALGPADLQDSRSPPTRNPSGGRTPRQGRVQVFVYSECTDGPIVAEVIRLDKRHGAESYRRNREADAVCKITNRDLHWRSARQTNVPREDITRLPIALSTVAVALGASGIGTAPERPRFVIIAVARRCSGLTPVVTTIGNRAAVAMSLARHIAMAFVIARVVIPRLKSNTATSK